jgi:ElaB/YqjD/DUF883 family membrane-anchored ribosome-binding protein
MEATREKLVVDIKTLLADVDSLLRQAAATTGDEARQLRQRAEDLLDQAQERFAGARDEVMRRGKAATRASDDWVHDNPWGAIGIAAALGLVVGFLIARR